MRAKTKMWLENYETFLKTRDKNTLSADHLNQIIYMHGHAKLHRHPKDVLAYSVNTINLLLPYRSTLEQKDTISPCAFLQTEEVIEDLSNLDWQECSVQFLETLSLGKRKHGSVLDQRTNCTSSAARESVGKIEVRKKRKVMNVNTSVRGKSIALDSTPSSACHLPPRST